MSSFDYHDTTANHYKQMIPVMRTSKPSASYNQQTYDDRAVTFYNPNIVIKPPSHSNKRIQQI